MRKTNDAGVNIVTTFEGLKLKAYLDTGGVPTIGYGHTRGVRLGQVITKSQALAFLRSDLNDAEEAVTRLVKVSITDNQFSALSSFVFNLGEKQFETSTLLRKLNAGDIKGAAAEFGKWVNDNGKRLAGLVNRRKAEAALFLKA